MPTNTIAVDQDAVRAFLSVLLNTDPAMFLKASNTDDALRKVAADLLAARNYAETEMPKSGIYPPLTVAGYLDQLHVEREPQFEAQVGRIAIGLYRRAYGFDPESVPQVIRHGSKVVTIHVAGYRGAEVRFIAEAMQELGF